MRVVVLGATGNVGTSVLEALSGEEQVTEIIGIARRRPDLEYPKTTWVEADVTSEGLVSHCRDADAVVHLAWLIQPSRDLMQRWRVNVVGTANVLQAVAEAGVRNLVYASSVAAYSPGPTSPPVDESWPTHGVATSAYSREKAYVERLLDAFELASPDVRVVRFRPALIFKREAASGIRRLFGGALFPGALLRRWLLPLLPRLPGVRFQAVHSRDVGDACRRAIVSEVRGAFNLAADPVLEMGDVADLLDAATVPVPTVLARPAAAITWRLRLHPVDPGWLDLATHAPVMDCRRVREELGWQQTRSATDAVRELLEGIRDQAGAPTPTLRPGHSPLRELRTGQGQAYAGDERTG